MTALSFRRFCGTKRPVCNGPKTQDPDPHKQIVLVCLNVDSEGDLSSTGSHEDYDEAMLGFNQDTDLENSSGPQLEEH